MNKKEGEQTGLLKPLRKDIPEASVAKQLQNSMVTTENDMNSTSNILEDSKGSHDGSGDGEDIPKNTTYLRLFRTAILIFSFTGYGMVNGMLYGSLADYRDRLNCTAGELSTALSIGTLGTFAAIPFSVLTDKYDKYADVVIAFSLFLAAAANIIRPYGKTLLIFTICEFFDDIAWTTLDNTANSAIPKMWKGKGQSPMLAMHLGFPVGATVGAKIASFFVSKEPHPAHSNMTDGAGGDFDFLSYGTLNSSITDEKDKSHIETGFIIVGAYVSAVAVIFLFLQYCRKVYLDDQLTKEVSSWKEIFMPSKWSDNGSAFGIKICMFFVFYGIIYSGCWASMGPFLTVYAVDSHFQFSHSEAATLSAVAALADALSTLFFAVCLTRFLSVKVILLIEVHGLLIASVGALILGTKYKVGLYFFVCLFQIFRGPAYGTIFSWVDHYIKPLCTLLALVRVIRNGVTMFILMFQGYLYDQVAIHSIFYTAMGYTGVLCILVYIIYYVTYGIPFRYSVSERKGDNHGKIENQQLNWLKVRMLKNKYLTRPTLITLL